MKESDDYTIHVWYGNMQCHEAESALYNHNISCNLEGVLVCSVSLPILAKFSKSLPDLFVLLFLCYFTQWVQLLQLLLQPSVRM